MQKQALGVERSTCTPSSSEASFQVPVQRRVATQKKAEKRLTPFENGVSLNEFTPRPLTGLKAYFSYMRMQRNIS